MAEKNLVKKKVKKADYPFKVGDKVIFERKYAKVLSIKEKDGIFAVELSMPNGTRVTVDDSRLGNLL